VLELDVNDAIAIRENKGMIKKANYGGEYRGSKYSWQDLLLYVVGVLLLLWIIYLIKRKIWK
jgi:hypothetical protein